MYSLYEKMAEARSSHHSSTFSQMVRNSTCASVVSVTIASLSRIRSMSSQPWLWLAARSIGCCPLGVTRTSLRKSLNAATLTRCRSRGHVGCLLSIDERCFQSWCRCWHNADVVRLSNSLRPSEHPLIPTCVSVFGPL